MTVTGIVVSLITIIERLFDFGFAEASDSAIYINAIEVHHSHFSRPRYDVAYVYISRNGRFYLMQPEPRRSLAGWLQYVECVNYEQRQLGPTLIKVIAPHQQPPTKCSLRMYVLKPHLTVNYNKFYIHLEMPFDHPLSQFAENKTNAIVLEKMSIGFII